jgi:hypothetical protein
LSSPGEAPRFSPAARQGGCHSRPAIRAPADAARPVEPSKKKKPKPAEDEEIIDEPKAKADDKAHGKSTH